MRWSWPTGIAISMRAQPSGRYTPRTLRQCRQVLRQGLCKNHESSCRDRACLPNLRNMTLWSATHPSMAQWGRNVDQVWMANWSQRSKLQQLKFFNAARQLSTRAALLGEPINRGSDSKQAFQSAPSERARLAVWLHPREMSRAVDDAGRLFAQRAALLRGFTSPAWQ